MNNDQTEIKAAYIQLPQLNIGRFYFRFEMMEPSLIVGAN